MAGTCLLLRHGTTEWNLREIYQSRTDIPLHPDSQGELDLAADRLAPYSIRKIRTSPLVRARSTAQGVADRMGIDRVHISEWDLLREADFGDFEGSSKTELSVGPLKDVYAAWQTSSPDAPSAPKGERWQSVYSRARSILQELEGQQSPVLLVGHSYILRMTVVAAFPDVPPQFIRHLALDNARISELTWRNGRWTVGRLNL